MASKKGFVQPPMAAVSYNFVNFLTCSYKIVTEFCCYLNLICLFFQNTGISYNRSFVCHRKWP